MITKVAGKRMAFRALAIFVLIATPAFAYVDPNTTGLITQSLTPLFVLGATVMVFFRDKAKMALQWLGRCFTRRTNDATE
jgi:hypothetical protein